MSQMPRRLELTNLRLGFACKERWEDMVGDDRVRACGVCDRSVFNLSAMTREEAEAVLATRGLTPCVRFYRRPDGTVMTSDCPTGTQPRRRLAVVTASTLAAGTTLLASSAARADSEPAHWQAAQPGDPDSSDAPSPETTEPVDGTSTTKTKVYDFSGDQIDDDTTMGVPVDDDPVDDHNYEVGVMLMGEPVEEDYERPPLEWSAWGRLGIGATSQRDANVATRMLTPPTMPEPGTIVEAAAGADLSLGLAYGGKLRVGAWGELRSTSYPVLGAELILEHLPANPYGRWVDGAQVVLRAGAGLHVITGAIGVGYVGGWPRRNPWIKSMRHVVGARIVLSGNRSTEDPRDWSATVGVEVDPTAIVHGLLDLATRP